MANLRQRSNILFFPLNYTGHHTTILTPERSLFRSLLRAAYPVEV
jgi:hypothetical protein